MVEAGPARFYEVAQMESKMMYAEEEELLLNVSKISNPMHGLQSIISRNYSRCIQRGLCHIGYFRIWSLEIGQLHKAGLNTARLFKKFLDTCERGINKIASLPETGLWKNDRRRLLTRVILNFCQGRSTSISCDDTSCVRVLIIKRVIMTTFLESV